jgi:lipoyl(octanoyl) transferase
MKTCLAVDLGLIKYGEAFALQQRLVAARKLSLAPGAPDGENIGDVLLLCEHPHVITLGRNGKQEHLLAPQQVLRQKGVEFYESDRGGDITYHGPGQIVGYPILNLAAIRRDVGWYVRTLEETMIRTSADFGVAARREAGKAGVWVDPHSNERNSEAGCSSAGASLQREVAEKLGAIGVHLSRWVTSHGFAYNVCTDLRYFDLMVPCGISGRAATSLDKILGRGVKGADAKESLVRHFGELFELQMQPMSREKLFVALQRVEQPVAVPA